MAAPKKIENSAMANTTSRRSPLALRPASTRSADRLIPVTSPTMTTRTPYPMPNRPPGHLSHRGQHGLRQKQEQPAHEDGRVNMDQQRLREGPSHERTEVRGPESHHRDEPHQHARADVKRPTREGTRRDHRRASCPVHVRVCLDPCHQTFLRNRDATIEPATNLPTVGDRPVPIRTSQRSGRSSPDPDDRHCARREQTLQRTCPYRPGQR